MRTNVHSCSRTFSPSTRRTAASGSRTRYRTTECVTMSKASTCRATLFSSSRMPILRLLARPTLRAGTDTRNWGVRVMFMNCLVENAAIMHLARKQDLKIAVSGAEAEAFVHLRRADLTSLAADAVAEHLGLFDHAQKSYWLALQAQLPH